jgi:hypothetical protein
MLKFVLGVMVGTYIVPQVAPLVLEKLRRSE